ncbi:hypothetical protein NDU88_002320 [Pleurodeles waltl]|uniref:Uncharacterized protein n=1 Tax=Pleurodeles waltl TaxID=8319 RepID=A0AAV7SE00_PLEWA|nr:hypothetical protein NDU88_002320 [Pleurodeles waltl]
MRAPRVTYRGILVQLPVVGAEEEEGREPGVVAHGPADVLCANGEREEQGGPAPAAAPLVHAGVPRPACGAPHVHPGPARAPCSGRRLSANFAASSGASSQTAALSLAQRCTRTVLSGRYRNASSGAPPTQRAVTDGTQTDGHSVF